MDFVAIDFELMTHHHTSACSIGMVKVKNDFIYEKFYSLINPVPDEKTSSEPNLPVHGIPLEKACQSPDFEALFPKIRDFIDGLPIVCHNASTDIRVLRECMNHFCLSGIDTDDFTDTFALLRCGLEKACSQFGVVLNDHHDALADAEACAKVYLACKGTAIPNLRRDLKADYSNKRIEKINRQTPDLDSVKNRNTPFFGSIVVITGTLDFYPVRDDLAAKLKSLGAKVNASISGKTSVVIVGAGAGKSKINQIEERLAKGQEIRIIREAELKEILESV